MAKTKLHKPSWCKPPFPSQRPEAPKPSLRMTRSKSKDIRLPDHKVGLVKRKVEDATMKPSLLPNPQSTCPLFKILPPEIRELIFHLALTSYEDLSRPRNRHRLQSDSPTWCINDNTYRPGFYHRRRTDTALLRTCQIIYLETNLLPAAINIHSIFYHRNITQCTPTGALKLFKKFTPAQLAAVRHVQLFVDTRKFTAREPGEHRSNGIFTEWAYLRNDRFDASRRDRHRDRARCLGGPHPKILTLTIRDTDWEWRHGRNYDVLPHILRNPHWGNFFAGLRELRMEVEVEWNEHGKLEPTVQRLTEFVWDIGNGEELASDGRLEVCSYVGPRPGPWVSSQEGWWGGERVWEDARFWVWILVWKVRAIAKTENGGTPAY